MIRLVSRLKPTWWLSWKRHQDAPKPLALTLPWTASGAKCIGFHIIETTK